MAADRLFQIIYLLLEREQVTAKGLADALGVSVRTVFRDVEILSEAGIPLVTTQGPGGGVALQEGYVLDRAAFTPEEQRTLLTVLEGLPEQDQDRALARLSALFSRREDDWLRVELPRWGGDEGDSENFRLLRRAVLDRRAVRFTYASSRGDVRTRYVLPAQLVCRGQSWYLQAYEPEKEEVRTFRLCRISAPELTEERFRRRLALPEEPTGAIPPLFRVDAVLRFDRSAARRAREEFAPACCREEADGSLLVECVFPDESRLYGYLLSFGGGVEVLEPGTLRRELARRAREIAEKNG